VSIFDGYNGAFFSAVIGDKASTIVSGSVFTFYGILKHDDIPAIDHAGRSLLISNTTMQVSASVAAKLPAYQSVTIGSDIWTLQEKRAQSNGQTALLILSKQ
jgi:hypothetical protein